MRSDDGRKRRYKWPSESWEFQEDTAKSLIPGTTVRFYGLSASLKKTEGNEPCCREVNRKEKTVYFMAKDYCWMIPGGRSPCKSPEFWCAIVVIIQQQAPEYQHRSWWYVALGEQRGYSLDNCCWISRVHKSAKTDNFAFFDYRFQEKALSWKQQGFRIFL